MILNLDICECCFKVLVINCIVEEYIRNRFVGFISNNAFNYSKTDITIVKEIQLDEISSKYNSIINVSCKDYYEFKENECTYFIINYKNFVVYNDSEKLIEIYVNQNENINILRFIGVKICELIVSILIENGIFCIHSSVCTLQKNLFNGIAMLGPSGVGKTSLVYQMHKCGEYIANDDVAFFKIASNCMTVYKNTQYIGFDNYSLTNIFSECIQYIICKDGLELDKNRIDLQCQDPSAYAEKIRVKHIIIIEKERLDVPKLIKCSQIEAYKALIQSLLPFFSMCRFDLMDEIARKIMSMMLIYKLLPCNSISKTVDFLLIESRKMNEN
jgi:hypothetical protein